MTTIVTDQLDPNYAGGQTKVDDRRFTDNGFKVELFVNSGRTTDKVDVTEFVESIDWTDSLDQAAVSGSMTLYDPIDPKTNERTLVNVPKGSRIRLSVLNDTNQMEEIGRFIVWEKERRSRTDAILRLSFYDMLIYLQKSEDIFVYQKDPKKKAFKKGWTASQITRDVCKRYGIPLGQIPTAKHRIPFVKVEGGSVYELLLKVWTEERIVTGNRFIIRCEKDKLRVIRKQAQPVMYSVAEGENLIDTTFTDSLEGMFTAVTLITTPESNSSSSQQSTDRTTAPGDTRRDVYTSTGGGWTRAATSFFTPADETEAALAYGDPNSNDVWGFGEAAKNQSSSGPFDAMGNLAGKTLIEVRYKGKTIQVPKVDVGAGGPGVEGLPRVMDLTVAAWDALGIPQSAGVVPIEWRLVSGAASRGNPTKTPSIVAKRQNRQKVRKYGYLHKLISLDKPLTGKDATKAADNYLKSILRENQEGTVTCHMLPKLRAGNPIYIKDEGALLVAKLYCSDVTHSVSASGCTTSIGLNWLDIVPSVKLTDEDKGITNSVEAGSVSASGGCAQVAIEAGRKYIGTPYSWGGGGSSGPSYGIHRTNGTSGANIKGFDCSGFVQYCWAQAGVSIPRHTDAIASVGVSVPKGQEQLGDLLLYDTSDGAGSKYGHVALWSGPGMILNSGGGGGGGVREYSRNDHVLVRRVSHLCRQR